MTTYLGIDVGTTAVKTIVIDEDQTLLASASVPHPILSPVPGAREQEPDAWLAAVEQSLAEIRQAAPDDRTVRPAAFAGDAGRRPPAAAQRHPVE